MKRSQSTFILLLAAAVLVGAARPASAQLAPSSCSIAGKNLYVRDVMNQLYLWYREMPVVNALAYESPEEYLEAVRYRPLDSTFSYITDRAANDAFFSNSQFIGLGLSTRAEEATLRVTEVYPASPAAEASLARGDRIVEINGRSVAELIRNGESSSAFGPSEVGFAVEMVVERGGGQFRARATKRLVTIPTVSRTQVFQVGSRRVGYVYFRNFVEPSVEALDAAFAELHERGADELVLDLRYNGGGLVDVALMLGSLIGGRRTEGQLFAEYFHNDKNVRFNRSIRFTPQVNALGLDRLVVITTRASASASELIINALRPFIPVVVIGGRTYGKPVGQYGFEFCDKVLAPVSFSLRNANGEGDFFEGFAPACPAADDVEHELGDVAEAALHEALVYIDSGSCSSPASAAAARARDDRRPPLRGWAQVVGAN